MNSYNFNYDTKYPTIETCLPDMTVDEFFEQCVSKEKLIQTLSENNINHVNECKTHTIYTPKTKYSANELFENLIAMNTVFGKVAYMEE